MREREGESKKGSNPIVFLALVLSQGTILVVG